MDRDHFYITLYSNASQEVYPDNKIKAFTIQLAQPIKLDPSEIWEVYYLPVEKRTFRDIRIEILNLSGERIAFTDSKTPLKAVLHFRRVITH